MSPGTQTGTVAACARLAFRLSDAVLGIDVADDHARRVLEDAYAPLLRPPGTRTHARAVVQRLSDGRLHVRYGRRALAAANSADAIPLRGAYHAAREIFAHFACEPPHSMALYGALCAVDNGAVLLLGPTTVGKTLLALQLARNGARFLGDETAVLSLLTGEAYALPRRPTLRESALPLLSDDAMSSRILSSTSFLRPNADAFGTPLIPVRSAASNRRTARTACVRYACCATGRTNRRSVASIRRTA